MQMRSVILIAIVVHVIFLLSVFDIYFKTPIIHGIQPQTSNATAPAKRLVLIVADGFRNEYVFGDRMQERMPMLYATRKTGSWGISHTRVPTESRPGHVAMIAGFYEDPSAVFKGWKENPVEFDSVFNQSKQTYAWGSPDILSIFSKEYRFSHIHNTMYSPYDQDFSGKKMPYLLDQWVVSQVTRFFYEAHNDFDLSRALRKNGTVFFLHLLGTDVAGHLFKPDSEEVLKCIKYVDIAVRDIQNVFNSFYKDGKTAFIFTSDHGMTDWGSHGSGHLNETETPFIAWGAGIRKDPNSKDIKQADIAPLMATLIGIPIPVNSIGILPIDYLKMSNHDISQALYSNARQIIMQYKVKNDEMNSSTYGLYKPFKHLDSNKIDQLCKKIENLILLDYFDKTIQESLKLIEVGLSGLTYMHTYYSGLILQCISLSYGLWTYFLFILVNMCLKTSLPSGRSRKNPYVYSSTEIHVFFLWVFALVSIILYLHNMPIVYYVYVHLPIVILDFIATRYKTIRNIVIMYMYTPNKFYYLVYTTLILLGIQMIVLSFHEKTVLAVALLFMSIWPYIGSTRQLVPESLKLRWCLTCLILSTFMFENLERNQWDKYNCLWQATLWVMVTMYVTCKRSRTGFFRRRFDLRNILLTILNNILIFISMIIAFIVHNTSPFNDALLPACGVMSYVILGFSLLTPMMGSIDIRIRLMNIVHGFVPTMILLSNKYEVFYLFMLAYTMDIWFVMEHYLSNTALDSVMITTIRDPLTRPRERTRINFSDYRRAYLFLFFIMIGFFGMGNIASLNSFDTNWTRCFVTSFSPFIMMALIIFKLLIPFIVVTSTFRSMNVCLQAPAKKLFLIVLIYCELMSVQFLHMVKNEGSWLDIGMSLSHYVIMQVIVLVLLLLYGYCTILTKYTWFTSGRDKKND